MDAVDFSGWVKRQWEYAPVRFDPPPPDMPSFALSGRGGMLLYRRCQLATERLTPCIITMRSGIGAVVDPIITTTA